MKKQITNFDLYKAYCEAHYTAYASKQTLLLIDSFETGDEDFPTMTAKVFSNFPHIRAQAEELTIDFSVVDIFAIPSECVSEILSLAHDNKWGWGDCVYIWHNNKLIWGRD